MFLKLCEELEDFGVAIEEIDFVWPLQKQSYVIT